ncbi:MAG: AAA family ATPase [Desulfobacteraceae bacterium]|nr:AAA family ATPase [Desulfobacteraceae bacterium]
MITAIKYPRNKHLLVTGCPGSGKTTVSLMRFKRLYNEKKKVLLITFQNLLRINLQNSTSYSMIRNIWTLHKWYSNRTAGRFLSQDNTETIKHYLSNIPKFDEILIDEGQDFEVKVYQSLPDISCQFIRKKYGT